MPQRVAAGGSVVNLGEAMRILELHREGLTISAIAERTGKDRKTVRKYIRQGVSVPSYTPRAARARVMDPYLCYVSERVKTFPELTASRLLREVRELGYGGGYTRAANCRLHRALGRSRGEAANDGL